jgi:hypothetical protein
VRNIKGPKITGDLLNQYWGKGVTADGDDPLDYIIDWNTRGEANWAVIKRMALPLSNYYLPFFEKAGVLYQNIYFIRAKKTV